MSPDTLNRAKALAAAIFWGGSFVATKTALHDVSPWTLITLRFAFGVVILLFAVWRLRQIKFIGVRDFLLLALLGIISISLHQALQATGLTLTSAGSMAWLVGLTPVFTALLAWLFLRESFGALRVLGIGIAFAGAILVVTKGVFTADTLRLPSTLGDGLALASALNWAIFSVISKPVLRRLPPTLMMAYVMTLGWLTILPVWGALQGWDEIVQLTAPGWIAIAFLGIFCSGIAYIFWYDALAHIDAAQVSAFIYLEPLVTMALAAVLLDEPITLITLVGGATIILGVYLVNRPTQQRTEVLVASE